MKKTGLENREGQYEFVCPNCGTKCVAKWFFYRGELHGRTGCPKCKIGVRI